MLFLLGGYDLEMVAIKELLLANNFCEVAGSSALFLKGFADRRLSWGAELSQYKDFFAYSGVIYGIELAGNIDPPENYRRIDHHNELSHLPASIEQVAEILGVTLNHCQLLVAANDKGYIPAMRATQASESEIKEIRMRDRQAQGVTEKDELLAEESINKQLRVENGITIVQSLTDKFSPITDRMYGKAERLLIYTDTTMVYYGTGASKVAEQFGGLIKEGKAYCGGGASGYFGLVKGVFDRDQIEQEFIKSLKQNLDEYKAAI